VTDVFNQRVRTHAEHVRKNGEHCTTEETTKQALILPLLDILGFSPFDPTKVKAEHSSDFPGVKSGERVDYALFCNGTPVMFVEAKAYAQKLDNHCPQLSRYYNATPAVAVAAITNGREWRFFTDLSQKNIMDDKPFLVLHVDNPDDNTAEQLARFHHDQFQPDALRALAEENIHLSAYRLAITSMLRECDADFVKFVATRAQVQKTFTARFVEQMQPIVKRAIAQAISGMVASSLGTPAVAEQVVAPTQPAAAPAAPVDDVDPLNSKIVTTAAEKQLLQLCKDICPEDDIQGKDTESYFSVLFQGKNNRWMVRFWADKKRPTIQFGIPLTDQHKVEIARARLELVGSDQIALERPDNILRLAGVVGDALAFCKNDENFRRKAD
jgi:hypothetical protein